MYIGALSYDSSTPEMAKLVHGKIKIHHNYHNYQWHLMNCRKSVQVLILIRSSRIQTLDLLVSQQFSLFMDNVRVKCQDLAEWRTY